MQRTKTQPAVVAMLAPATGLITVFVFVPMLLTIWLSFQSWSTQTGFETAHFSGVQNFIDIFSNSSVGRDFKAALLNTLIYTGLSVALILPLSVAFGLLVHQKLAPGGIVLRTILFSVLARELRVPQTLAASITIGTVFILACAMLQLGIRSRPLEAFREYWEGRE